MSTETKAESTSTQTVEQDLAGAPSFIERQFPVAKVSMESYKERKANHAQTLTGLGKWWGRKPLVLVRATVLGLLLPATDYPKRDQEIFLKLMTMDRDGMLRRKNKKLPVSLIHRYARSHEREYYFFDETSWRTDAEIAWHSYIEPEQRDALFSGQPTAEDDRIIEGPRTTDTNQRKREIRQEAARIRHLVEYSAFQRLPYSDQLDHCMRPEEIDGPDEDAWSEINDHLKTNATSLPELVEQLGLRRFGHRPRVGDSFCGAGSIPFESARIGCDVYASDLSPVAALLTWSALNIVGGGPEVAAEINKAHHQAFDAVDKQVTAWGIEHNEKGWRADAYLYCVEVECPECKWMVPLAPSWIIGEKTHTIAVLVADEPGKRFEIEIKQGVTSSEVKAAGSAGTVGNSRLLCPNCKVDTPIDTIRRLGKDRDSKAKYHVSGLRLWENCDLIPRPSDVFQERLYCVRWVETYWTTNSKGETVARTRRWYESVTDGDIEREKIVLELLEQRFHDWQIAGYIPSRAIEPGKKTTEPIRTRGWTHWHHLYAPRQLLLLGTFAEFGLKPRQQNIAVVADMLLEICREIDTKGIGARMMRWNSHRSKEMHASVFSNQALNVLYNFCHRTRYFLDPPEIFSEECLTVAKSVEVKDARQLGTPCEFWITDPPYADAVIYHELSEFFLAWYEKHLVNHFDGWHGDSRRTLAVTGDDPIEFRRSMVECYSNLVKHMPDDGMQVVMFTHQDASVWADLTTILWASGLRVTAAWCIATETDSALKQGNYVQGTVLLVCRKRTDDVPIFLDEINHKVEEEVRQQLSDMLSLDDNSEPNFGDADYQLAAYAAALRVLTEKPIEDIDPQKEISRVRPKGEVGPVEMLIRNAVKIACDHLVPTGIDREIWKTYTPIERFYLKGLEVETHGERRSGVYQELARGFGAHDYDDLMASSRANETRLKTATEFAKKMISGDGPFASSLTRQVLYAVYTVGKTEEVNSGLNWLKTELPNYWDVRTKAIHLLNFFGRLDKVTEMAHWKQDSESARLLAGALHNDLG